MKTRIFAIALAAAISVACSGGTDPGEPRGPAVGSGEGTGAGTTPAPPGPSTPGGTAAPPSTATPAPPPASTGGTGGAPPGMVAGHVAVGYGGLRLVTRDGGKTWSGIATSNGGGDDYDLLRAVAHANGKWLAVGWSATTSTDGVTWTPMRRINQAGGVTWNGAPSCGLVEGLTSDGTYFYAACAEYGQPHKAYRSADGTTWTALGTIGNVGGHPALAHRGGVFYAYGDPGTSFRSTDAVTWTVDPGLVRATFCENQWKSRAACHEASWFGGFYFQSEWQSKVTRSADGVAFVVVHDDASNNSLYAPRAMAEGFVKP